MARKKQDPNQITVASLTRELDKINAQMKEAYERFNYTCESELIDACIFEIEALRARYTYVLRCIKELSGGPKRELPHAVPVAAKAAPPAEAVAPVEEAVAATAMKGGPICRL